MSGFVVIITCVHAALKAPSNDFMEHEVASDTGLYSASQLPHLQKGLKDVCYTGRLRIKWVNAAQGQSTVPSMK